MNIGINAAVSLVFELHIDDADGELVEKIDPKKPFEFIFGAGQLLGSFEKNIEGLESSKDFEFKLSSEDAYGTINKEAIIDLPREVFSEDGKESKDLKEGNIIHMMDKEENELEGKVIKISKDSVNMDFNHPMAGKNLYFKGTVISVRDATREEIEHGHVHGPGGHEH